MTIRVAEPRDVSDLMRIRARVRENRLADPSAVSEEDVLARIAAPGRGWVSESAGVVVGFSIVDPVDGQVWALFVDPDHESEGHGRRLHDTMLEWAFANGAESLRLGTDPGTRAERFYRRAGWFEDGLSPNGELRFTIDGAGWRSGRTDMDTRKIERRETFPASPAELFGLLITPSAIRAWWDASRTIVLAEPGGLWAAAWGEDEDSPDYVTAAVIRAYEPPRKLVLADYRYHSKDGALPFEADFTITFRIDPAPEGARLTVIQDGFPVDTVADDFVAGCERGWHDTFAGIRRFLAGEEPA